MSLQCSFCCYCSSARLDLIEHAFSSHSFDPTFHFVCGIRSCLHRFKSGATFELFKTHAHRKHPHWQEDVNDSRPAVPMNASEISSLISSEVEHPASDPACPLTSTAFVPPSSGTVTLSDRTASTDILSPKHAAALFLLTFKEHYKISQKAVDYAVGAINTIIDSVHASVQAALQQSSGTTSVALVADPFSELRTEYQQTTFYRQQFGLVVSTNVINLLKFILVHV